MLKDKNKFAHLNEYILARSTRRELYVDIERMRYSNYCMYNGLSGSRPRKTLVVGMGHGHDVLLALLDGLTETVVGVDPYIAEDGSDDEDYNNLLGLIKDLGLSDRFIIKRQRIEEYLASSKESVDLAVFNDSLHHIYWTEQLLGQSVYFTDAVNLFQNLRKVTHPDSRMIITERSRHGLRAVLTRLGYRRGTIIYGTKQPWREWDAVATAGGWTRKNLQNYIPYKFRAQKILWSGMIGRYTLCDKYFLYFLRKVGESSGSPEIPK